MLFADFLNSKFWFPEFVSRYAWYVTIVVENNNTRNWLQRKLNIFLTTFLKIFLPTALKNCIFKRQKDRNTRTVYVNIGQLYIRTNLFYLYACICNAKWERN